MPTTIVSPGVAINVNDNSAVTSQPIQAGAAIIGPTVKGPVGIPTVVTTYSEYQNQFGDILVSGSQTYSYLTSISAYNYFNNGGSSLLVTRVVSGSFTPATASIQTAFVLETLSEGEIMNSVGSEDSSGYLTNGTADNYRWQIVSPNTATGTFSLLIRKGNDSTATPSTIETHTNLSLDPFSSNYIEKRIGNSIENVAVDSGEYYLELTGSYPNNSKYVRVKQVLTPTPNYLDNAGSPQTGYAAKIPVAGRGAFGGATGKNTPTGYAASYYEAINDSNTQGIPASAYTQSIALLANKDSYRYNFITVPGLIGRSSFTNHFNVINTRLIPMIIGRGDTMAVIDIVEYGQNLTTTDNAAAAFDTSFVATYWPWAQTIDPATGQNVWVPASTLIPGVYMASDRVSYPWIAPAGTNRGIMANVTRVERVITQSGRDTLYEANVNPLATLPGYGVVVYGQKTLQKKNTALDRVNVRRLLIELNNYIGQIAQSLVFEQNTSATRNEFLAQVNPYLSTIQQQQGLYDFNVVMDDTNNTPTVIDNNQLVGQIYIQPTKTSEFILLEFNILPTGVTI
jgi:phage tail sheath protein FI